MPRSCRWRTESSSSDYERCSLDKSTLVRWIRTFLAAAALSLCSASSSFCTTDETFSAEALVPRPWHLPRCSCAPILRLQATRQWLNSQIYLHSRGRSWPLEELLRANLPSPDAFVSRDDGYWENCSLIAFLFRYFLFIIVPSLRVIDFEKTASLKSLERSSSSSIPSSPLDRTSMEPMRCIRKFITASGCDVRSKVRAIPAIRRKILSTMR